MVSLSLSLSLSFTSSPEIKEEVSSHGNFAFIYLFLLFLVYTIPFVRLLFSYYSYFLDRECDILANKGVIVILFPVLVTCFHAKLI